MKKRAYKITAIDGLEKDDFPIVDLYTEDGERFGCCTTALLNVSVLMGLVEGKRSELALEFNQQLKSIEGITEGKDLLEALESWQKKHDLEFLNFTFVKPSLYFLLVLLINDFYIVLKNKTADDRGHLDVIFYREATKEILFNAFTINQGDLEILTLDPSSMFWAFRDQRRLGRVFISEEQLKRFTVSLRTEDRYFLSRGEELLLEKDFFTVLLDEEFRNLPISEILDRKLRLLKNLNYLADRTLILR